MALSTYQVYLMKDETPLVPIKSFPDLGGAPETLDTTTLSDKMTTSILGIQSLDALTFDANYTPEDYDTLDAQAKSDAAIADDENLPEYAVWFGAGADGKTPDGHNGKFACKGRLAVFITGGGVNEVVGMSIAIAAATPIEKVTT